MIADRYDVVDILVHAYHQKLTHKPGYAFLGMDHKLDLVHNSNRNVGWNKFLGREDAADVGKPIEILHFKEGQ